MSVLNQSGEEQVECPLCMEPLEVDDLNFYPCTCGYQICRFCWHRIRTDENGLCPACRKAYSENPADFIPLSQEQVAKLKAEKRQRDQQRKAKLSESRKHLASVRVVQRNLVFVVGLPMRLADAEILKRHEYFGKFGKIHKVVINQSTSYAGSQGPSASAYVTYMKSDDALRAIESVNNIMIDGRLIKSSLGTTKYCSHFMKNQPCPKPDCMYLHDFGDPDASFTKEEMHAGKHQEYEKKLHEALLHRTQLANNNNCTSTATTPSSTPTETAKAVAPQTKQTREPSSSSSSSTNGSSSSSSTTNKENWPQLNVEKEKKEKEKGKKTKTKGAAEKKERKNSGCSGKSSGGDVRLLPERTGSKMEAKEEKSTSSPCPTHHQLDPGPAHSQTEQSDPSQSPPTHSTPLLATKLPTQPPLIDDNSSFFSSNAFHKVPSPGHHQEEHTDSEGSAHTPILTDAMPAIDTTEDWAAAFGFSRHADEIQEKARKEMMEPFGNRGFPQVHDSGYNSKGLDSYNSLYELNLKENLLDVLASRTNGFGLKQHSPADHLTHQHHHQQQQSSPHLPNGVNGLDQNMSKFFMDFHKNNKDVTQPAYPQINGFNGVHQNGFYQNSAHHAAERLMFLQQKQLEDQLMHLTLNKGFGSTNGVFQNGGGGSQSQQQQMYVNGDVPGLNGQIYGNALGVKQSPRSAEDELDFDPFQETQKALAELMATEQSHKGHNSGRGNQINGVVHSQSGGHVPPPPPGFVQPNTHMNSFGSKILPYLNMSNSQQQINSSSQNWPSSSFSTQQQQQQHKNLNNTTCNDWKILDPAILSSSRHYQLANMPQIRPIDNFTTNIQQLGTQQIQNGPSRSYDYSSPFSNFTQQPNYNNFTHLNTQQNSNWFTSELNSQISSPPGFRNNQTSKQQEC